MVNDSNTVQMMSSFDPYMYHALEDYMNKKIVVQTTKNPIQGKLTSLMPDHIVIDVHRIPFMIRIQQIVWVSAAKL